MVEFSSGSFPTNTVCGGHPGFSVAPYARTAFTPSADFNGAITPITNGMLGTRFEINFHVGCEHPSPSSNCWIPAGGTFYDADMETGISRSTLGPSDNRRLPDGRPSLAGEQDPLAKANAAWLRSPNRWELLRYPKYVVADKGERLVWVHNDKAAPQVVRAFFQLEAGFMAYMGPGSVEGWKPTTALEKQLVKAQDTKSWWVNTQDMVITIY
ncbi:MAG: hypothetical protein L6R35_001990 [Caloplaca aegaea]|nr:MAG: hypothetical protein L6R35_001990 [Caloplaca aegaea]